MRDWITFFGISLLGFAIGQDLTSVTVSLSKIQAHTTGDAGATIWVNYLYLLTIAVLLPVFDHYSKVTSRRKLFLYGGLAFTLGEYFIARSGTTWLLFTARIIQGVGTACLIPAIWEWVLEYFTNHTGQRLRPFILLTTLGLAVGPLVAAAGMHEAGVAQIDTVITQISLLGTLLSLVAIPKEKFAQASDLDIFTPISLAACLFFLLLPIVESIAWGWISYTSLICYAIAGGAGAYYFYSELNSPTPIYQLRVFLQPRLLSWSISSFVMGWIVATLLIAVPVYSTAVMEKFPFIVAITMLGMTFTQFITFHVLRSMDLELDTRMRFLITYGGFILTAFLLSNVSSESSLIFISIAIIPAGVSWGMAMKIITETNDNDTYAVTAISPVSHILINSVSFGALIGTAFSFTYFKMYQKLFALDQIREGKLLLPVDVSGSTTGLVQTIFDMGNIDKLGQHVPYHTLEKLVPILKAAGTSGIQHLCWLLIAVSFAGFAASFIINLYFVEKR